MKVEDARKNLELSEAYLKPFLDTLEGLMTREEGDRYILIDNSIFWPRHYNIGRGYIGHVAEDIITEIKPDVRTPENSSISILFKRGEGVTFDPYYIPLEFYRKTEHGFVDIGLVQPGSKIVIGEEDIDEYLLTKNSSFKKFKDTITDGKVELLA